MPNWTHEQQDAITDRGHSLIVCAAAGSGKTAVLVERIVQLICEGCPVDNMLVVTFTNAAASEMRQRIGDALGKAAAQNPALSDQLMALPRASISTLHRFCGNLLREHFHALGIDPAFRIADEQECGVLARQAMEDALYACYETADADFMACDACYTQEEITEIAGRIYTYMMTRPDPWAWLDRAVETLSAPAEELGDSGAVQMLLESARDQIALLREEALATLALCRGEGSPMHYEAACAEDVSLVANLCDAAARGYNSLAHELTHVSFAALGRKKKTDVFSEEIAEAVKARREALKKNIKNLTEQFALSLDDAAHDLRMTQAPLRGFAVLLRTYDALYSAARRQRGVMNFNDLEHLALKALEREDVRRALYDQYRFVFVDEYQDSSAIQEAILGAFTREDGQFCVGDVKQSIYRFRQAEPALFLDKAARYDREDMPLARRIDLQRNFRSRANVLAGVNSVFEMIMRADVTEIGYDAREQLIPGLPQREDDPPLELHILYRAKGEDTPEEPEETEEDASADDSAANERELAAIEREALIACARIRELVGTPFYDAKSGSERPLAYRDMAILMRVSRGLAPLVADILQQEGIPAFCDAGEGYFDMPEIRAVMALLAAIDNGAKDVPLLAALRGPAGGLTDAQLADIRIHTPDAKIPFYEAVRRYMAEVDDETAALLRAFDARLARWRLCARHQGMDTLIGRIYSETGFVAQAGALPGGASRQANLHLLISRARSYMQSQGGSLTGFLRYAQKLQAGGDSMSASAIGESEDVVRIMTTHKSKGLEFPVVFVLGMGRKMNTQTTRARVLVDGDLGVGLPCVDTALSSERDTLLRRAMRISAAQQQLAEEVRILYVAMTRARERLILIGEAGAEEPPARWQHAGSAADVRAIRTELDMVAPVLMHYGACLTIPEEAVTAGSSRWHIFAHTANANALALRRDDGAVTRLLAELAAHDPGDARERLSFTPGSGVQAVRKTTVSAVLRDEKRAADDEIHQRDVEIMRLPRFMSEKSMTGAQIGTAFHRAMCMIDLGALRGTPSLEAAIQSEMDRMLALGVLTEAEYRALPAYMLVRFFASPVGVRLMTSDSVQREWAFTYRRETEDGQIQLVQGVIDCCFMEDGQWVLVDYKTDKDAKGAIERHRGQLALYADALHTITGVPVSGRILYLVRMGVGSSV